MKKNIIIFFLLFSFPSVTLGKTTYLICSAKSDYNSKFTYNITLDDYNNTSVVQYASGTVKTYPANFTDQSVSWNINPPSPENGYSDRASIICNINRINLSFSIIFKLTGNLDNGKCSISSLENRKF